MEKILISIVLGSHTPQLLVAQDEGRADVILAGSLAVIGILDFKGAKESVVSLSDLLEGVLVTHIEGEDND